MTEDERRNGEIFGEWGQRSVTTVSRHVSGVLFWVWENSLKLTVFSHSFTVVPLLLFFFFFPNSDNIIKIKFILIWKNISPT